jgi:hypothetical protein
VFGSLFKTLKPASLPGLKDPSDFSDLAPLPKLPAVPVETLASAAGVEPPAALPPGEGESSTALFATLLNEKKDLPGATKVLATALPESAAIEWACESCELVADKLPPADQKSLAAAKAWVKQPGARQARAASEATKAGNSDWPGWWAAQAVVVANQPAGAKPPGAVGAMVAGSVALCAQVSTGKWQGAPKGAAPVGAPAPAVPSVTPAISSKASPTISSAETKATATAYRPFLEKGIAVAKRVG